MKKSVDKDIQIIKGADHEAAIIIRSLMCKHWFIQPECRNFDVWDKNDAAELVADLI